jgi:hypothetical protein
MRSYLVIVSTPTLQLFSGICQRQEPVRVQAFRPQSTVECLDESVVGRLSRSREVECHVVVVQIPRDEFAALIDANEPLPNVPSPEIRPLVTTRLHTRCVFTAVQVGSYLDRGTR